MPTDARNLLGQKMGPKGWDTRQKIMDASLELLKISSYNDLSVSDIVVEAGISNATFYVYFKDVEEVLYACVKAAALDLGDLHEILGAQWDSENLEARVDKLVELYNELWEKYRVELRVRNLEADQGNLRFLNLRIETTQEILRSLGKKVAQLNPKLEHPNEIAVAIHAAMSALAAQHDMGIRGTARQTRKKLNAGVAEMICTILKG